MSVTSTCAITTTITNASNLTTTAISHTISVTNAATFPMLLIINYLSSNASMLFAFLSCSIQVVLCPGTHLYFDHPQEPDPEERGLYWACRYADTKKVFSFAPGNLFSNADMRLTGEPFSHGDVDAFLEDSDFEALRKEENVIG